MGKGNVCVNGEYEGLYFIGNEHLRVYTKGPEDDMKEELSRNLGTWPEKEGWTLDWVRSEDQEDDVLECITSNFTQMFPSFERPAGTDWVGDKRIILESSLFYIAVEDNETSLAVELLQKEGDDGSLKGLQKQHYERYLDGLKRAMLMRLPYIGCYTGPWTSGTITKEDVFG